MYMKIVAEKIVRYYVEEEGCIYGGPFDTREEAVKCLKAYREQQRLAAVKKASN